MTAVAPVFARGGRKPAFAVAVRAHHADIGGAAPGSMAPQSDVFAEGLRIPPVRWIRGGVEDPDLTRLLLANVRDEAERRADLAAQVGALACGVRRLDALGRREGGLGVLARRARSLVHYARKMAGHALSALPDGAARVRLRLEVETLEGGPAGLKLALSKRGDRLHVDFAGTSGPVRDGLNAPAAVTRSAVYYLLGCLAPPDTPANDGLLACATIAIPGGSFLDARPPLAVAGGNVETSQRVVDALWLAAGRLWPDRVPAPGAGTMSNWTFGPVPGGPVFPSYYETVPAGAGGGPAGPGADAIQQHMTNTRSTPVEVLESRWPVRVERHAIRAVSGGLGRARGGDGVSKSVRFLAPAVVSLLMTRHEEPPPGAAGGRAGQPGRATLTSGGRTRVLEPRGRVVVEAGDVLTVETPGGGGWGRLGARRVGDAADGR